MDKKFRLLNKDRELKKELELFSPDEHLITELFKKGTDHDFINDDNREEFYPLLMSIEESFLFHYDENPDFKDSEVIETLKRIRDNIDSKNFTFNELEKIMIMKIKAILFFNNYSKKDLLISISCLLKSVKFWKEKNGSRGYLNFIDEMLGSLKK